MSSGDNKPVIKKIAVQIRGYIGVIILGLDPALFQLYIVIE